MTQAPAGERGSAAEDPPEFAAWRALGMLIQLVVTDPAQLDAARDLLDDDLAALDLACSRFRPDSELVAVGNAARGAAGPVTVPVSPLLAEAVAVSLRAASSPTATSIPRSAGCSCALGYDRDFGQSRRPRPGSCRGGVGCRVIPGWRSVRLDPSPGG